MRTITAMILALCISASASAASPARAIPLKVEGDTVTVIKSFPFTITAAPGASVYVWNYPSTVRAVRNKNVLTVQDGPQGEIKFYVQSMTFKVDFDKKTQEIIEDAGEVVVNVGKIVPPTPTPPGPGPVPSPDTVLPIAGDGLRVMIIEESGERSKLPAGKYNILFGARVRDYLAARCAKDKDDEPEARIWDKDIDVSGAPKHWQDAFKRQAEGDPSTKKGKRASLPWLMISNGKEGYEGDLPESPDKMLELLKKYGG